MSNKLTDKLGAEYRAQVYAIIQNITGKDLDKKEHFILKGILKQYVNTVTERDTELLAKLNKAESQLKMLQEQSHFICNRCKHLKGKKN